MPVALISFGSNVNPERNVPEALRALAAKTRILSVSPVYETPPVGREDAPRFLNGAVRIETDLSPEALEEKVLHLIERDLGRVRTEDPNAPRTIDLDLVFYGDRMLRDPAAYAFVAVPVADLEPDRVHPVGGKTLAELASAWTDAFPRRRDVEARILS